jgi:hypothetical protein
MAPLTAERAGFEAGELHCRARLAIDIVGGGA